MCTWEGDNTVMALQTGRSVPVSETPYSLPSRSIRSLSSWSA
jgi:hypothetical protein